MKSVLLQQGVMRQQPLLAVSSKGVGTPDTTVWSPACLVCPDLNLQLQQIYGVVSGEVHSWYLCRAGPANFASFLLSAFLFGKP